MQHGLSLSITGLNSLDAAPGTGVSDPAVPEDASVLGSSSAESAACLVAFSVSRPSLRSTSKPSNKLLSSSLGFNPKTPLVLRALESFCNVLTTRKQRGCRRSRRRT